MSKKTLAQIRKDFPGLAGALGQNKKPPLEKTNAMRKKLCDFARDNSFVVHPGRGYDYYVDSFFMFNACPCDVKRLSCPCEQAVEEVAEKGYCLCRLFWRSYDDFKEKML